MRPFIRRILFDRPPAFQVASLTGARGAVYDIGKIGTLFVDRAGTTPVTADGDLVGVIKPTIVTAGPDWTLRAQTDAERGTYKIDGNGKPYVDLPSGKRMRTDASLVITAKVYVGLALARSTLDAEVVACFNAPGGGMTFQNHATTYRFGVGSARSGSFASPNSRVAAVSADTPTVIECQIDVGSTSAWINGGERDITDNTGLDAGETRSKPNTWTTGDAFAGGIFGLNYNTTSETPGNVKFYGGVIYLGIPRVADRRAVTAFLKGLCGLSVLHTRTYDLFAIAGQSNAMGVGVVADSTAVPFGNAIEYHDTGYIKPLVDPTQHAQPGQASLYGSAWPAFGKTYFDLTGRRACMIGGAWSGEGLINPSVVGGWLGSTLVPLLASKVATAKEDVPGALRGVIYLGGEQDVSSSFTVASYKASLVTFRNNLRTALGAPALPLFIMSLDDNAASAAQYALMRQAMAEAADENEGIDLVMAYQNFLGAGHLSDGIHWDQTALNTGGAIAAQGVVTALGG